LFDQAKIHISLELERENHYMFMVNSAAVEFALGNNENSLVMFKEAMRKNPEAKLSNYYQTVLARAFVSYVNSGVRGTLDTELIKMAQLASASEQMNIVYRLRLRSALLRLSRTDTALLE
jgi:hypothetical protein